MNNDDNKLTTEQEAQHNAVTKHENSTDTNTQSNTDSNSSTPHSDTKTNVKADSTTNADEAFKANTNEKTTSNNDTHCETEEKTWHNKNAIKRGIAMLGYGFLAGFVRLGITLIAVFQFFSLLFSEKPNQPLVKFGQNLNTYQYQINQFLTVNSEIYPFPFADWPDSAPKESVDH